MIDYYAPNIDLTLLGCGFLANYHLGAIYLLSQVWPHKPYNRICGASCGGVVAALLVSGVTIDRVLASNMYIMQQLRAFIRKPCQGLINIHELLEQLLQSVLPLDAHKICTNRLGVSVTILWPPKNLLVTRFESKKDLIDAVLAGCFIPIWSGSLELPKYKGHKCVDGGYSNNKPEFPDNSSDNLADSQGGSPAERSIPSLRRLQLCAFTSDTDICPPDKSGLSFNCLGTYYYFNWTNISRCLKVLIPFEAKTYKGYLVDGHRDMKNYIISNNMVKCQQCAWIAPASTSVRWPCLSCLRLMEKIDSLKVPQNLIE